MADLLFDKHILAGVINGVRYERENRSENYVTVPPAFLITDSDGAMWTFGQGQYEVHNGEFEFPVMRNDVDMKEVAKRIEYSKGRVRIFGHYGWKTFSRNRKAFI